LRNSRQSRSQEALAVRQEARKISNLSNPCVVKLTMGIHLPARSIEIKQVSDGNALEQNLEVADLQTRA
jgi:hypothetical protein